MSKRIGASSKDTIAPTLLTQLNQGELQTATLSESLAVDFAALMHHLFPTIPTQAIAQLNQAKDLGITKRMELAATILVEQLDPQQLVLNGVNEASI